MKLQDRFKIARERIGLSQRELAERVHASQVMISKIEQGRTSQPRRLEDFARVLNVSAEWLQFGINPPAWVDEPELNDEAVNYRPVINYREVPIVSWIKAGDFCCTDDSQVPVDEFEKILCPEPSASEKTFALTVVGDSMTAPVGRSYPEGTIIFVDPLRVAKAGDRVIARTDKGHTFKELAENEYGEQYLKPLNPNPAYQPIFDKGIEICGVVIGSYVKE